jgi:hypothetical protein
LSFSHEEYIKSSFLAGKTTGMEGLPSTPLVCMDVKLEELTQFCGYCPSPVLGAVAKLEHFTSVITSVVFVAWTLPIPLG